MNKEQKSSEVAVLKDMLSKANNLIVTDHTGINVADISILRRKLRESKSEFRVAKNTLLKKAVKDSNQEMLEKYFEGPTSVVFGYDDLTAPAKIIYESIKETEKPVFKAYYYEGKEYDFDFLKKIAELPPRDQVIAGLIGSLDGVITKFIGLLEAAPRELIGTIDSLAESRK